MFPMLNGVGADLVITLLLSPMLVSSLLCYNGPRPVSCERFQFEIRALLIAGKGNLGTTDCSAEGAVTNIGSR